MSKYKRLRDLRDDNDKTQKDIAEILNITRPQYHMYESGKRDLPIDLLRELCKYYNVSADYILELTDKTEINR